MFCVVTATTEWLLRTLHTISSRKDSLFWGTDSTTVWEGNGGGDRRLKERIDGKHTGSIYHPEKTLPDAHSS